jgi:quinol monooxygenase YgiN
MSGTGEFTIVARYQVRAGHGDEVALLLGPHIAATRAEPGCLEFTALRSTEHPDAFVLYERYASREAFDAHRATPHFETIVQAKIVPLLDDRAFDFYEAVPAAQDPA